MTKFQEMAITHLYDGMDGSKFLAWDC